MENLFSRLQFLGAAYKLRILDRGPGAKEKKELRCFRPGNDAREFDGVQLG